MSDLFVENLPPEGTGRIRPATIPEVVAWLREQGAIDYEAVAKALYLTGDSRNEWMWENSAVQSGSKQRYLRMAHAAVAALRVEPGEV